MTTLELTFATVSREQFDHFSVEMGWIENQEVAVAEHSNDGVLYFSVRLTGRVARKEAAGREQVDARNGSPVNLLDRTAIGALFKTGTALDRGGGRTDRTVAPPPGGPRTAPVTLVDPRVTHHIHSWQ